MALWLAFMAVLGMGGIVYSVSNPPTEPVVHCKNLKTGEIHHFMSGSCGSEWVQFNLGDEPKTQVAPPGQLRIDR